MATWRTWVKWNRSIEQTFIDAQHLAAGEQTIAEARKLAVKTGSPGVLLVDQLADHDMLGRVWVLSGEELHRLFGSKTPAKRAIESDHDTFVNSLPQGQAVAITAYLKGLPTAVLFAGQPDLPRARTITGRSSKSK